jgi:hypothetical protein
MTSEERGYASHDCGGDVAAYVLGALEREEAEAFRGHLGTCAICRDEVSALERVADVLPMAATQYEVPRELRRRVLTAVRAEPRGDAEPARAPRVLGPAGLFLRLPRPALAAALAAVLALAAVAGGVIGSGGSSGGARVISATASAGSAQLRLSGGHAELIVRDFPSPPAGHVYEVWLQRRGRPPAPTSTLFTVTSRGSGDVGLAGNLHGVQEVLVTPEPAGGSLVPTHKPVIAARLT